MPTTPAAALRADAGADAGAVLATAEAAAISPRRLGWAAAVVGFVAVAISAIGSWIPSFWGDEAATILSATRPLGSLLRMLGNVDAVHGLFYLGMQGWVAVFGTSAFAVRFPAALAVGATAAAVVWLCGRFGPLWFAVLGGVFAAILPRLTYAGEEARSYAFAALLATVLCVIVVEIARRPRARRGWWVAYALVFALGVLTFLYLGLMLLAVAVMVVSSASLRHRWRTWLIASAGAVVLASPVIVFGWLERRQIAFLAQREVVTPPAIFTQMWFGAVPFAIIAWALILIAAGVFMRDIVRSRRADGALELRLETIALAWLVIPMGLLIAVSPIMAGYTARYGTLAAPAAAVLMAIGVLRLSRLRIARLRLGGWIAGVVVAAVVVAAVPIWAAQRSPYAKNDSDWNDIAATVHSHAKPGDAIVFDESSRPSQRPRLAMNTNPAAFAAVKDVTLRTPTAKAATWHDIAYQVDQAAALGRFDGVSRVWVVEFATGGRPNSWGLDDLRALGFRETQRIDGHRNVVFLYER